MLSTVQTVMFGALLLGAVSGVVGCFTILRRQSLLGDALAHAALPGICLAYMITGTKTPAALLIGALVAGLLGALFVVGLVGNSRIKEDSAIGIVLSVFFGLGVVLLTYIQRTSTGNQSGLDRFLFGQAATLMERDVQIILAIATIVLFFVVLFYKEFKLLCFDREFGEVQGFPMRRLEVGLTALLVVVVVVGLQTVGVVLIVAALITPAAAARQWTDSLGKMLVIAALIGGGASVVGVWASATIANMPTGPTIVMISSAGLVLSLLAAPRRGILGGLWRSARLAQRIRRENLLKDIYRHVEAEELRREAVSTALLRGARGQSTGQLRRVGAQLRRKNLLAGAGETWRLTEAGILAAQQVVRKHRLWELYLTRRLELAHDHVHRDAEAMEHALSDEFLEQIDKILGYPEFDPHGREIPRPGSTV